MDRDEAHIFLRALHLCDDITAGLANAALLEHDVDDLLLDLTEARLFDNVPSLR